MVPYGYAVDLYENDNWTGAMMHVEGKPWGDSTMLMPCINVDAMGFHNKTSSLRVYRTTVLGVAGGTWKSITATSAIGFKVSYGYQYDTSKETSSSMEY